LKFGLINKYGSIILFILLSIGQCYYLYKFIIEILNNTYGSGIEINLYAKNRLYFEFSIMTVMTWCMLLYGYSIFTIWRFFRNMKHLRVNEKAMCIQLAMFVFVLLLGYKTLTN
jgi:hypothetical protein